MAQNFLVVVSLDFIKVSETGTYLTIQFFIKSLAFKQLEFVAISLLLVSEEPIIVCNGTTRQWTPTYGMPCIGKCIEDSCLSVFSSAYSSVLLVLLCM